MYNSFMNTRTKRLLIAALIFGGMGFFVGIFLSERWLFILGVIIVFAIGGAGWLMWLMSRRKGK